MSEYKDKVEYQKQVLKAEKWANRKQLLTRLNSNGAISNYYSSGLLPTRKRRRR